MSPISYTVIWKKYTDCGVSGIYAEIKPVFNDDMIGNEEHDKEGSSSSVLWTKCRKNAIDFIMDKLEKEKA